MKGIIRAFKYAFFYTLFPISLMAEAEKDCEGLGQSKASFALSDNLEEDYIGMIFASVEYPEILTEYYSEHELKGILDSVEVPPWAYNLYISTRDHVPTGFLISRIQKGNFQYFEPYLKKLSEQSLYDQCVLVYLTSLGFNADTLEPSKRLEGKISKENVFCHCSLLR